MSSFPFINIQYSIGVDLRIYTDMEVILESILPSLEGVTPVGVRSVILPFILEFATSVPLSEQERDFVIQVNRTNNLTFILEGHLINSEPTSDGILLASKASVEAMPVVKVLDEGIDCSICLVGFKINEEAKEMPCKHHFHSIYIGKWLRINRSCPICTYKMPVDEQCEKKDDKSDEDERGDDGGNEMEEDRLLSIFHVVIRWDALDMEIFISKMPRIANRVLIGGRAGDLSDARDGGVSEDRDDDEFEVVDGGDVDESEVRDEDDSEAQDMVIDNN